MNAVLKEIAELIADIVGFNGDIEFDASKPDGTPRKLVDTARINSMGWHASTSLRDGLAQTYNWYLENVAGKTET